MIRSVIFFFIGLFAISASAEVESFDSKIIEKEVSVDQEIHRMRIYLTGDYTMIGSPADDGSALTAFGLTLQGLYAFTDRFAGSLSFWQSFTLTGASVITSFDGRLTYAITGKLTSTDIKTNIDNTRVLSVSDMDLSGFRAQLLAVQYYFNASTNTVPYHGFGFAAYYEHITHNRTSYIVGGRFDTIANSEYSAMPMQFFLGVGTPF